MVIYYHISCAMTRLPERTPNGELRTAGYKSNQLRKYLGTRLVISSERELCLLIVFTVTGMP